MIVPGSTYWNIAFGREKGEVLRDQEGLRTARNFARKIVWLIKKIKGFRVISCILKGLFTNNIFELIK